MQKWIFDIRSRPFVLLVVAFLIVTALVYWNITKEFDKSVVTYFHLIAGNTALDLIMQSITEAGDVFYMLSFSAVLLIIKRTRRIGLVLMILLVMTTILTGYIKCGVDRQRPQLDFLGTPFFIEVTNDTFALFCEGGANASFPSGHAARAAIFGIVLGYVLSERFPHGCYLLLLYPFFMSLSRIYVLQHYPMDVIGGVILGALLSGVIAKRSKLYKIFDKSKA